MRRPVVSLLLMGAVLLLTVGAAVATFKGLGDDGEMRASLEESSTPIVEDDTESRTTEDTTSKKETTSKTDKKTDRKTRAEKRQKTPKAEKTGKTTRAGKSGVKSAAGKGDGKARSGRGGNPQQASGGRAGRTSGEQAVPTATLSQMPEQVTEGTLSNPTSTETPVEGTLSPSAPGTADVPAGTGPDGSTDPNGNIEDDIPTPSTGDTTDPGYPSSPEETDEDDTPELDASEVPNDPDNPTSPEDAEDDTPEPGTGG